MKLTPIIIVCAIGGAIISTEAWPAAEGGLPDSSGRPECSLAKMLKERTDIVRPALDSAYDAAHAMLESGGSPPAITMAFGVALRHEMERIRTSEAGKRYGQRWKHCIKMFR